MYQRCQKEVIREIVELLHVVEPFQAVNLDALVVVDVGPTLLCDGVEILRMQPPAKGKKKHSCYASSFLRVSCLSNNRLLDIVDDLLDIDLTK